jgi:hypothetical protein
MLAVQNARNLRCSGAYNVRVVRVTAYKIVTDDKEEIAPIIEVD